MLKKDAGLVISFLHHLDNIEHDEWKLCKEKNDVKIWYRYEPGNPIMWAACECEIEGDILHVCSLFSEVDLYPLWVPKVKTC